MFHARSPSAAGFSLIELLVAMMVFSLLTIFAYRAVSVLSLNGVELESEQHELVDVNKAFYFISRDLLMANVSTLKLVETIGEEGEISAELVGLDGARQLAVYGVKENSLFRKLVNNRGASDEKGDSTVPLMLLRGGVDTFDFELVTASVLQNVSLSEERVPVGVNFKLVHQRLGKLSRTIYLNLAMADPRLDTLTKQSFVGGGPQIVLPDVPEEEIVVDEVASGW